MSFLFPSVLWGLFASLIPLIVHLFNQNTTKTVEFSSIQHIKALESDSIRSLKLKQWILVLIRSLIIQEPFDEAQHMTPMLMEAIVTGDNAKNVYIGQDKILSGIFTAGRKKIPADTIATAA